MAVTLGIEINQNSYDEETNTSIVNVSVRAYYTTGSYNATGNASGTLYINGMSYPFKATFNSMQQDNGNEVIYSETVVIDHSVTNVVDCSATFNTGISSGTISASNSLTLSGDSSGGDEPEEDEPTYYNFKLNYNIDERIVIRRKSGSVTTKELTGVGTHSYQSTSTISPWYPAFLQEEDSEYYDLIITITNASGDELTPSILANTGEVYYKIPKGTHDIVAVARPKGFVYIENEIFEYPSYTTDCIVVGHANVNAAVLSSVTAPVYSTSDNMEIGYLSYTYDTRKCIYFLKFTTSEFNGNSNQLKFEIPVVGAYSSSNAYMWYWLTSSDDNYMEYANAIYNGGNSSSENYEITDDNIVTDGVVAVPKVSALEINVPITTLEKNKTYYLILYQTNTGTLGTRKVSLGTVKLDSIDTTITSYSKHIPYCCYIDNGVSWDMYIPYIDNGTSFDICY